MSSGFTLFYLPTSPPLASFPSSQACRGDAELGGLVFQALQDQVRSINENKCVLTTGRVGPGMVQGVPRVVGVVPSTYGNTYRVTEPL